MILFLLLCVEVALSLSQMHKMRERLAQVVEAYSARSALAQEMQQSSRERAILLHAMISTDDPFDRDDLLVDLRTLGSRLLKAREQIAAMTLSKTDDAKNLDELVRLADNAMYYVKRSGKGNHRYHQAPRSGAATEALPFQW
ncbi:hypothetical protein [Rhabdochromatium marinum]|uniref:hypothetical protein n=1 Tax=Rhabdochromatium marinum TaxID=48729 RepID=UPI0019084D70|nr:hypothetical protein [Rhabdochromatium marinum]MBK1650265.1 hypothetical protein [Rhabdochromatium marinum]